MTLLPEHITDFYSSLNLGQHSSVTMLTGEAKLITRYPPARAEMHDRAIPELENTVSMLIGKEAGGRIFDVSSPFDDIRRDVFYKKFV